MSTTEKAVWYGVGVALVAMAWVLVIPVALAVLVGAWMEGRE